MKIIDSAHVVVWEPPETEAVNATSSNSNVENADVRPPCRHGETDDIMLDAEGNTLHNR